MSLKYYNEQLQAVAPIRTVLTFKITGAAAAAPIVPNSASLISFGAISQAQINELLGSTNEFDAAAFDSTAMGADATGVIANFGGQIRKLSHVNMRCFSGTGGADRVERSAQAGTLTASTLETACAVSSKGNLGVKTNWGNTPDMDALTGGTIEIEVFWFPK